MTEANTYQKYLALRREYGVFIYESFDCELSAEGLALRYRFRARRGAASRPDAETVPQPASGFVSQPASGFVSQPAGGFVSQPEGDLVFLPRLFFRVPGLPPEILSDPAIRSLAFHIGMVEMISYWKACCSPVIHLEPHLLQAGQQEWWKKLFRLGLAEFFYTNGIPQPGGEIFDFSFGNQAEPLQPIPGKPAQTPGGLAGRPAPASPGTADKPGGVMVPLGGGKDSAVTLETLIRQGFAVRAMVINQRGATREVLNAAGLKWAATQDAGAQASRMQAPAILEVDRTIDPLLLELNARGYLNGHTPFSAMLAFVSTLAAWLAGDRFIALSNESSASEATIPGTAINHQYSKSLEFESDFRTYASRYLGPFPDYFSFLRPLNELQIAALFSRMTKYHGVFRSCNAGSKTDTWCRKCSKCLFTFVILSPFLESRQLTEIFGGDLFKDAGLKDQLDQLTGLSDTKPFDCVGTVTEVNAALCFTVRRTEEQGRSLLPLLLHYRQGAAYGTQQEKAFRRLLAEFATPHHLPREFERVLGEVARTLAGLAVIGDGPAGPPETKDQNHTSR